MRAHGRCTECLRTRRVTVTARGLAHALSGHVTGVCDDCEHGYETRRRL